MKKRVGIITFWYVLAIIILLIISWLGSLSSSITGTSTSSTTNTISQTSTTANTTTTLSSTSTSSSSSPPGYRITVKSNDLNGTVLSGFYVDVRVSGNHITSGFTPVTLDNLQPGVQYQVVIYWAGNYYFRHFSNGNLNRYDLVTLNSTVKSQTLDALYQYVPRLEAASLDIIAQLPNGTQIGTAFDNNGYPQHTPGMWFTVAPPDSTAPFTGTFTGGSILPYVLFNHQTYTVAMTAGYGNYQFAYWKDTGSTNAVRTIALNGNASYIAVYYYITTG